MAGTWDFCPKGLVVENIPPEQPAGMSMNGWNFSSKPTVPYQFTFKVTLHGLNWFLANNSTYDAMTLPTINAARFEKFIRDHGTWDDFAFPHPHLGTVQCRFKNLPMVPRGLPNSYGLIEAFEVELVHHNPAYNFVGAGSPPYFVAAGALVDHGASINTTMSVPYPAGIQENDIAVILCYSESAVGTTHTITTPTGFASISEQPVVLNYIRQGVFWKRLTGTETGTVSVPTSIGSGAAQDGHSAVMFIIRGCVTTGTPYEAMATTSGQSTALTGSAVTTLGAERLVAHLGTHRDSSTVTPAAGYTENLDISTTVGSDNGHAVYTKSVSTAQAEAAPTNTLSINERWRTVSLAFIPA